MLKKIINNIIIEADRTNKMMIGESMIETKYFDIGLKDKVDLSLPLAIQIELTELCNLKCPFCYNNSGVCKQEVFPLEKWKKMLYQLKELGGVFQCAFSGGEPLLYKKELLELMDILHNDRTGMMLITNAFFLDQAFIDKLCKYDWYWIQISLDSYNCKKHDKLRGVKGSFDKAITAIKELKKCGLPVAISSVICSENSNDVCGIVELACDMQVDVVLLSPALPVGRAITNSYLQLNSEKMNRYEQDIQMLIDKYSSQILIKSAHSYDEQMRYNNLYPPYGLLIRPNGDVKIDCLSQEIVGNVFESSIDIVWKKILKEERWKHI